MLDRFNLALFDGLEPNVGSKRAELGTAMSYETNKNVYSGILMVSPSL